MRLSNGINREEKQYEIVSNEFRNKHARSDCGSYRARALTSDMSSKARACFFSYSFGRNVSRRVVTRAVVTRLLVHKVAFDTILERMHRLLL